MLIITILIYNEASTRRLVLGMAQYNSTSTSMAEFMIICLVLFVMDSGRTDMHHLYNMQCFAYISFLTYVANNFWDISW